MTQGRFPGWNLVADLSNTPWREASRVSSKDRLPIPTTIKRNVDWMDKTPVDILGVMDEPGQAMLLPWVPDGERVRMWLSEASNSYSGEERDQLLLEAQARYVKFSLDRDGRVTLPPNLLGHLGVSIGQYVWTVLSQKGLWISGRDPTIGVLTMLPADLP